ncbi:MAG: ABC transporter ATP-binding protein [Candidatus Aureabacteria bacterium]|nr:ABC transporter ATP-binding protein [Candidatus Auribacterota bacterium]
MILEARDVTVQFSRGCRREKIRALDGFNLQVQPGDFFALLGPNGAGKSTALYCFLGLIQPDRGSVSLFGQRPAMGSPQFDRIAYLPEEPHYHLYLTVEEAIRYYGSLYREAIPQRRVREVMELVGLSEFNDLLLGKCSKGMKQKAGIAASILKECDLLFLDEPTRGLDPIATKEFRDILMQMHRGGTTIIINSHILSEVEMVSDHVAIMDHGRVLVQDELRKLMQLDRNLYSVEFGACADVPEYVVVERSEDGVIRGTLPSGMLSNFLSFAQGKGLAVYECSLKKNTLEEIFMDVLKGVRNAPAAD